MKIGFLFDFPHLENLDTLNGYKIIYLSNSELPN